jgi:hypothetical protein
MMRALIVLAAMLASACSMTPTQKRVAWIAGGVLVAGAVAAHELDHGGAQRDAGHVATPSVTCGRTCAQ